MVRKVLILFCVVFAGLLQQGHAQNFGLGAAAIYNFQTESFGFDARASLFPDNRLSIVPQITYFPSFNKIHEYFLGIGAEYDVYVARSFQIYGLVHGAYNGWINYESSAMENAAYNNWNLEGGGGICGNGCWRPFLEGRYNARFRESHVRVGVLYVFGCNSGNGHGGRHGERCPAYN